MANPPIWTPLHAQVHRILRDRHLLPRNQPLLVAVSGGQDSLCLIKLLLDLQPKWGWHLGIAHCDHRWRPDSQANANHVEQLARTWQVPYYLETAPETPSITSEAAARQWRYQALSAIAQTNNFPYIVTGHTASDRAETLLYNLMRGSGADGLQALTWQRPLSPTLHPTLSPTLQLVRPLLEVTRAQTAQFCQEFQIPVWEDSTNQDFKYARNRIRQELLPYLQTHFNPQVEQTLAKTAELLRADVQYLEEAAQKLLQQALANEDSPLSPEHRQENPAPTALSTDYRHDPRLNRLVLRQAPLALQRRVMRHFLASVLPIAPSFEQIEKLTALITAPNRSQTDPFPGGAIAQVDGAWISIKN